MSSEPQRYDPIPIAGARREDVMEPVRDGDYVLFSDWEAENTMGGKLPYKFQFLMERAVQYPVGWEAGSPRWSAVGMIFSVGANNAIAICKAFGFDPNEVREKYEPDEFGNAPVAS